MTIPLKTLIDDPEAMKRLLEDAGKNAPKCLKCKRPLHTVDPDDEHYPNGWCSDCYYEALGEEIEQHPICSPSVRRG